MAHMLARLLGAEPKRFELTIHELERATGHAGVDVMLIGDILMKSQAAMRMMGLDPHDTTAHELYQALGAHADEPAIFKDKIFVGVVIGEEVISCSRADVRRNLKRPFTDRVTDAMQKALRRELEHRYHSHNRTINSVVTAKLKQAGIPDLSPKKTAKKEKK